MKCKQRIVSSCDPCAFCPNWRSLPMILLATAAPLMVRCCCRFIPRFLCLYLYWCCYVVLYVWILRSPMFLWKHAMSVNIRVILHILFCVLHKVFFICFPHICLFSLFYYFPKSLFREMRSWWMSDTKFHHYLLLSLLLSESD